jgi:hypothetical protein
MRPSSISGSEAMKVLRSALRFLLGLIAATIAAELTLRIIVATPLWHVLPVPTIMFYGPNADTGFSHRPNISGIWTAEHRTQVRTSSLGLLDRERPFKRGEAPRAIVIGDSLIEAVQVEQQDTSTTVAERVLSAKRRGAEVVNLGLQGVTPAVQVARLQSIGLALQPDVAVLLITLDWLLSDTIHDDSLSPGYKRNADGRYELSYAFRDSFGYRFRTSQGGAFVYWLLDHSAVARVVNARRNAGWLAEWPKPAQAPQPELTLGPQDECRAERMARQRTLWIDGQPADAAGILDAVIRDLAAISRDNKLPVVLVMRNIGLGCERIADQRKALTDAIAKRLSVAGLGFADFDALLFEKNGSASVERLHGFGKNLGSGHLNIEGNRIYGEILAAIIDAELQKRGR